MRALNLITRPALIWLFGLAVGLYDAWSIWSNLPQSFSGDEWRYALYGSNLSHGFFASRDPVWIGNGPLYPLWLAPFSHFEALDLARVSNALWHALGLVYLGFALPVTRRRWVLAALVPIAAYGPLRGFLPLLVTEVFCFFLACGWLFHALRATRRVHLVLAGCFLGALCLIKVIYGVVVEVALVVFLLFAWRGQRWAVPFFKHTVLAALLCVPWLGYTYALTGKVNYWAAGGTNIYWASTKWPEEWGDWYHQGWVERTPSLREHHLAVFREAMGTDRDPGLSKDQQMINILTPRGDDVFWREARTNISEHPLKFLRNSAAGLVRLFLDVPTTVRGTSLWNPYSSWNAPLLVLSALVVWAARRFRLLTFDFEPQWRGVALFLAGSIGAYAVSAPTARFFVVLAPWWWLLVVTLWAVTWRRSTELRGVLRSLVIYYGQFWRNAGRRRFYAQFLQAGDLAIDVGAHVGDRVRTWRQLGARVIAVEPQPAMEKLLRRFYGRDAGVTLVAQAIGAAPGRATLHVSSQTPTLTTLSSQWIDEVQADARFRTSSWDEKVEVEVTTLDALIARYGVPRFCKIDVEGLELDVLRGLSQPIAALSFEYLPVAKSSAQACVRRLAELGDYRFRSSRVETMTWSEDHWLTADEMVAKLEALEFKDGSGDVYARLERARASG